MSTAQGLDLLSPPGTLATQCGQLDTTALLHIVELLLACQRSRAEPFALNPIDGKAYPHHPVLLQVPLGSYPLEPGVLTELNGLKVPAHFDCESRCNVSQWNPKKNGPMSCPFGNYRYYLELPSRWHACHMHEAFLRSKFTHVQPQLPLIDEEYFELVAVYQSVLRACGSFHAMELGARWGTWGFRSVALLRLLNPMPYQLFLVESHRVHCAGIHMVAKLNGMDATLKCAPADADLFLSIMSRLPHLDLLHIDIQREELQLLSDSRVRAVLNKKVYRIILGTHGEDVDFFAQAVLENWITVFRLPHGFLRCMQDAGFVPRLLEDNIQQLPLPAATVWSLLQQHGCFHTTQQGRVANMDGSIIVDNPRFVNASKAFYINDMVLQTDDLMK